MEAVLDRDREDRASWLEPYRFGNRPDQVEVSRRGAAASKVARKLSKQRRMLERLVEAGGMAGWHAAERLMEMDADLEDARIDADRIVRELRAVAEQEAAAVARLREERAELEAGVAELADAAEQLLEQLRRHDVEATA